MFVDPAAEVVWAGLMTLDVALQHQVLRGLASTVAASLAGNPKTPTAKIEKAVAALHEAYELLGRSPSVRDYVELCKSFPELPPEGNIRAWLGCGWSECLTRSLLPTPSDGDFTYQAIEHSFELPELIDLVLACTHDLDKRASRDDFFAWVRRPDVIERFERRPTSDSPFRNFGGWLPVVEQARKAAARDGIETPLLKTTPRVYDFTNLEITDALKEATGRLQPKIGDRSPRTAEYQGERMRIQQESIDAGDPRALPTVAIISNRFEGWDMALIAAGLKPLGGSGTKSKHTPRKPQFSPEDKADALRRAWAEIGEPFVRERYVKWRKGKIVEAELRDDRPDSVHIPSADVIETEFRGWRCACQASIPGYALPHRRWHKRPGADQPETKE